MAKQKTNQTTNKATNKTINQTVSKEQTQEVKTNFEEKQPTLSKSITLSKDGKWLIIKTIRTDIIHINYMQKILTNTN